MEITYYGHSCFKIVSSDGSLVFDPYKDGSVSGLKNIRLNANLVLCSHEHADHYGIENVEVSGKHSFNVSSYESYHDDKQGTLRGMNTIYKVETEGLSIVHLGDLGCQISIDDIKYCDVLFIPIGGHYTINTEEALKVIDKIQPKIVIPMHYSGKDYGYSVISDISEFVNKKDVQFVGETITITKDTPASTFIMKR